MRRRTSTLLALAAGVVAVACALTTAVLAGVNGSTIPSFDAADPIGMVMPVTFAAVGVLVATRQPRNATGWLFLFIAVVEGVSSVADQYARLALITHPGGFPGAQWALWFSNWSFGLVWPAGAAALLLILLPNGHLPSPRWRPVVVINLLLAAVFIVAFGLLNPARLSPSGSSAPTVSNPTGVAALAGINQPPWDGIWFVALAVVVAAAAAPFIRLRRARGDERQQLKWIAYAVLVSALSTAAVTVAGISVQTPAFNIANTAVILLGFGTAVPIAAGIAIFKYGLYEIDVVISRTLVYGTLAVLITAVYVGIAVGFGALAGSGGKPNLALSIVATAIVALGFQPARERLQRLANRLVYGTRATPYEVLSEFSARVSETYAGEEVLTRMARVLRDGTGAEVATVWRRVSGELQPAATCPDEVVGYEPQTMANGALPDLHGATRAVPVRHQRDILGALSIVKRRGESLTPLEAKLLDDLAHQAGLVLRNVGLTADLRARLEELRASRQRLVAAQDEERRHLERNLHDGAQQLLVALKVQLGLLDSLMAKGSEQAATMLDRLEAGADEALETLRDLARGIYPPLLADKGLVAALESQARKASLPVTIEAEGIERYRQDVEATVYFCVLEALQNVQKYAEASHVVVHLRGSGGELRFEIVDDGRGFDAEHVRRGAGITNMTDRIDSLDGRLEVRSRPGHGTAVHGAIPLRVGALVA